MYVMDLKKGYKCLMPPFRGIPVVPPNSIRGLAEMDIGLAFVLGQYSLVLKKIIIQTK